MKLARFLKVFGGLLFVWVFIAYAKYVVIFLALVVLVLCAVGIIAHELIPKWGPRDWLAKRRKKARGE